MTKKPKKSQIDEVIDETIDEGFDEVIDGDFDEMINEALDETTADISQELVRNSKDDSLPSVSLTISSEGISNLFFAFAEHKFYSAKLKPDVTDSSLEQDLHRDAQYFCLYLFGDDKGSAGVTPSKLVVDFLKRASKL